MNIVNAVANTIKFEDIKKKKIKLPTHFPDPVEVENITTIGSNYKLLVRKVNGYLEEVVLTAEEINKIEIISEYVKFVNSERLVLLVESYRIRNAYSYDPYFAVSLSGIQTLPHQIEAVYGKMLPQPRLRFLLADDPGAGKTIMAGLLIKELKMRLGIEKILIIVPANLKIQWQDELLRFFNEYFIIVDSELDRQQAINIWHRENQIIVSMDYAKQLEVRERIWQQNWDIVIVDEVDKCSAYTKRRSNHSPEREATKRYQLVEKLSSRSNHLLLLTVTPHYGDDDRFFHFLRLLDPDVFPEPHKFQKEKIKELIFSIFSNKDNTWILRRLKEDLCDLQGRPLFTKRHTITISFKISIEEYELYEAVANYLNRFLALKGEGLLRQSIALTRTVFQRRLASSTYAIYETLKRRLQKQEEFLNKLEKLSDKERRKLLEKYMGLDFDEERDDSDLDEKDADKLTDEFISASGVEELKEEIEVLKELIEKAKSVYEKAPDTKLNTLKECLERSEFAELKDGRGKLLIFTEHRDTLLYLKKHIESWGFSTCEIHGLMDVHQRKKAQEDFRTNAQICIATEAAGEGINLQFCHLVINYDLPWNPARLEQRMGRVHRIGQKRDVYIFNFVAEESIDGKPIIEGKVLKRLLDKIERMKKVLGEERVYDVIGEILSINKVDLAEILREAAYNPHRLEEYLERIEKIDPERLKEYEKMTGIALARAYVDFSGFQRKNFEAEEKRLMPEYVERYFKKAAELVGLKIEKRADGLLRIPYVPADFRSDSLESVRRFGKPEEKYTKITFHKEHLEKDQHIDAVLVSPGHPIYAVVDEKLMNELKDLKGKCAVVVDLNTHEPYWIHFLEFSIVDGKGSIIYKELSAVKESKNGEFSIIPPDIIHDLAFYKENFEQQLTLDLDKVKDYLMANRQIEKRKEILEERKRNADIIKEYLEKSFDERIYAFEGKIMEAKAEGRSNEDIKKLEEELDDLHRIKKEKLKNVKYMTIVRSGPVSHIASFFVLPSDISQTDLVESEEEKLKSEQAAMEIVMEYERKRGWEPEDVSSQKLGFDIRSLGPADPKTGYREVRRIEVKGRKKGENIRLTVNEWLKAKQLRGSYWLYVVWNPTSPDYEIVTIPDPAHKLEYAAKEIKSISHYEIDGKEIQKFIGVL